MSKGSKNKRRSKLFLLAAKWSMILGFVSALALGLYAALLIPRTPSFADLLAYQQHRSSVVLSAEGKVIEHFSRSSRRWIPLEEISPHVVDALIATEDRRFYAHHGIDFKRTAAAVVFTLLGDRQGGSTITQQLARNMYPETIGSADLITRKLMEMITAWKIESVYSKEEILEAYLNTVPFLYNAFGIEMAARTYFDKSADELTLSESATLVGMLKGTSYYNPVRNPERAQHRRNVVLFQLVKVDKLSRSRYETLRAQPIQVDFQAHLLRKNIAPHFTRYVRNRVEEWAAANDYNIYTDGLRIHTTLDVDLQRMANEAVDQWGDALQRIVDVEWGRRGGLLSTNVSTYARYHDQVDPFSVFWETHPDLLETFIRETDRYENGIEQDIAPAVMMDSLKSYQPFMDSLRAAKTRLEVGFAAIDPRTGHIKAWVGSRNFLIDQYDHVVQAQRQPGSTFKPFVYAAALEEGFMPYDTLPDRPVAIPTEDGDIWTPVNAGEVTGEPVTLRAALAHSKNIITARLTQKVGAEDVAQMARVMGVNKSNLRAVPSIGLGTSEVTLLEMVSAYSTIADRGTYRQPLAITEIEDNRGRTLVRFESSTHRAVSKETTVMLLDMMRDVIDEGTGRGIRATFGLEADLAGKTGTTEDGADGWFIMMHPELVAGSWVGFDDPRVTFRTSFWGQGARTGLFVVGDFFQQALHSRAIAPEASFPELPAYLQKADPSFASRIGRWVGDLVDHIGAVLSGEHVPEPIIPGRDESSSDEPRPDDENRDTADQDKPPIPAEEQEERRTVGW